jgi:hypothetical protein
MAEHGMSSIEPVIVLCDSVVDKRTRRRFLISLFDFLEVRLRGCQRYKRLADEFPLKENVKERVSGFVKQIHVESKKSILIKGSSNVGCRSFEGAKIGSVMSVTLWRVFAGTRNTLDVSNG